MGLSAKKQFKKISLIVKESAEKKDVSLLLKMVESLEMNIVGDRNSMLLNCEYRDDKDDLVKFHYHSYDQSGPFQLLPDLNKVSVQLFKKGKLVKQVKERFEDKSVYG